MSFKPNVTVIADNQILLKQVVDLLSDELSMRQLDVAELIVYLLGEHFTKTQYEASKEIQKAYSSLKNYDGVIILPDELAIDYHLPLLCDISYVFYLSNSKNARKCKEKCLKVADCVIRCHKKKASTVTKELLEYFERLMS